MKEINWSQFKLEPSVGNYLRLKNGETTANAGVSLKSGEEKIPGSQPCPHWLGEHNTRKNSEGGFPTTEVRGALVTPLSLGDLKNMRGGELC